MNALNCSGQSSLGASDLPQFVRDLLSATPNRGEGLNNWLFRAARVLHPFRERQDIVDLLFAVTADRHLQRNEIERAVERSKSCAWHPGGPPVPARRDAWPALNDVRRASVIESHGQLADLWEASPVRFEEENAEDLIDALFPGNPLLCVGQNARSFDTKTREEWRGQLGSKALIVPSPMTARLGHTQDGRTSAHTLETTRPRHFLIIEQDLGSIDEQAAVISHLGERAPLAVVVHSGGKSLHAWFRCLGQPETRLRTFMRGAVALGADRALWTRSQFARLPAGLRDNGSRQGVLYFNPEVLKP